MQIRPILDVPDEFIIDAFYFSALTFFFFITAYMLLELYRQFEQGLFSVPASFILKLSERLKPFVLYYFVAFFRGMNTVGKNILCPVFFSRFI